MRFRSLHRNLQIRLCMGFFNSLLANMVFPFMVIYFAQHFGAAITGVLMTVNVALSMISNIYGGFLSDRYGRKRLMMVAESTFFLTFLGIALANSPWWTSPVLTYLMTATNGIAWGCMGPALSAMIIDVTTTENRKYVFGINYWSMNLAMSVAGLAGGFLFQAHRFGLLLTLAGCGLTSLLVLIFFIQETHTPSAEKIQAASKGVLRGLLVSYKTVVRDKTFLVYAIGAMLLGSIEWQARNYVAVRLAKEFGTQQLFGITFDGVKMFGFLASENSVLVVLLGLIATKIVSRQKDTNSLLFGIVTTCIGFAVVGVANDPMLLVVFMGLATLGEVFWVPVSQGLSAELPDTDNRSAYMAFMGLSFNGKQVLGSVAVALGAWLPSYMMSALFVLTGVWSYVLMLFVIKKVEQRQFTLEERGVAG